MITTDASAACIGAHGGRDGGVIVVGTGSIGWAEFGGRQYRVGGWGLPISDEGSGSWIGGEALRRVLWAYDRRVPWSPLLRALLVVKHAQRNDPVATELMRRAASHIDAIAARLIELGAPRLALVGGLAPHVEPWVASDVRSRLTAPAGDALDGAVRPARTLAESIAA
jgi:glucosamine kinase